MILDKNIDPILSPLLGIEVISNPVPVLDGLILRLNSIESPITQSSEKAVKWENMIADQYHATQSNNSLRPSISSFNNFRSVLFNSSNSEYMQFDSALATKLESVAETTIFAVYRFNAYPQLSVIFSASNSAQGSTELLMRASDTGGDVTGMSGRNNGAGLFVDQPSFTELVTTLSPNGTDLNILSYWASNTVDGSGNRSNIFHREKTSQGSPSKASFNNLNAVNSVNLGANIDSSGPQWHMNGHILEILLYERPLDDSERSEVNSFLSDSWNIDLT